MTQNDLQKTNKAVNSVTTQICKLYPPDMRLTLVSLCLDKMPRNDFMRKIDLVTDRIVSMGLARPRNDTSLLHLFVQKRDERARAAFG